MREMCFLRNNTLGRSSTALTPQQVAAHGWDAGARSVRYRRLDHAVQALLGGIVHEGRRSCVILLLELFRQVHECLREKGQIFLFQLCNMSAPK